MTIAIWKTGHTIADTVAEALAEGLDANIHDRRYSDINTCSSNSVHMCYGILRGAADVFAKTKVWFNVDRGYFYPGHYEGYYRISYRGTQAKWHDDIPRKPYEGKLEPWRGFDHSKPVLVCPPTDHVREFFNYTGLAFETDYADDNYVVRRKGDTSPINFLDYNYVITFNSSMGWKALQAGIPCISDPEHSIIGSYYAHKGINLLTDNSLNIPDTRLELFEAMQAHQFTLNEIRQGKAWPLIKHYLSGSDLTQEKPLPLMSVSIPSVNGLQHRFQSAT